VRGRGVRALFSKWGFAHVEDRSVRREIGVDEPVYTMPDGARKKIRRRAALVLGVSVLVVSGYLAAALVIVSAAPQWYEKPGAWFLLLPALLILCGMFFVSPPKQMIQILFGLDRLVIYGDGLIPLMRRLGAKRNRRLRIEEIAEIGFSGGPRRDDDVFTFTLRARDGAVYFVPSEILKTLGVDPAGLAQVREHLLDLRGKVESRDHALPPAGPT
jgi:hypothetical protein